MGIESPTRKCDATPAYVEAVFIEGHTDKVVLSPSPQLKDNLDLSAIRATNTFRALLDENPMLLNLESPRCLAPVVTETGQPCRRAPVLSVSGYGEYRPAELYEPGEEEKAENRRIDLRILMATPTPETSEASGAQSVQSDFASERE